MENIKLNLSNLIKLIQENEQDKIFNLFKKQPHEIKSIVYYFIRKQNGVITEEENNKYNEYLQESFFSESDLINQWNILKLSENDKSIRNYTTKKLTDISIDNWFNMLPNTIQIAVLLLILVFIFFSIKNENIRQTQDTKRNK